jgi:hypothetical protein
MACVTARPVPARLSLPRSMPVPQFPPKQRRPAETSGLGSIGGVRKLLRFRRVRGQRRLQAGLYKSSPGRTDDQV